MNLKTLTLLTGALLASSLGTAWAAADMKPMAAMGDTATQASQNMGAQPKARHSRKRMHDGQSMQKKGMAPKPRT